MPLHADRSLLEWQGFNWTGWTNWTIWTIWTCWNWSDLSNSVQIRPNSPTRPCPICAKLEPVVKAAQEAALERPVAANSFP